MGNLRRREEKGKEKQAFVLVVVKLSLPFCAHVLVPSQSCSGCSLNRLHEVRRFVKQEAAYYEPQVKVKFIG